MKLSDASEGDTVVIDGKEYRLMIRMRDHWGCRVGNGEHRFEGYIWFRDDRQIESIILEQPKRNPSSNKARGRRDISDPMG